MKFLRRNIYLIMSFFIPAAVHLIAFAIMSISPFGKNSMMVIDNFHQYTPFLSEFRDMLRNGDSLFYSWNSGLGTNFWARYGYYLASPLNFLSVFVKGESLPEFIVFLTAFRTGIAGAAFYTFLTRRSKLGEKNADSGKNTPPAKARKGLLTDKMTVWAAEDYTDVPADDNADTSIKGNKKVFTRAFRDI